MTLNQVVRVRTPAGLLQRCGVDWRGTSTGSYPVLRGFESHRRYTPYWSIGKGTGLSIRKEGFDSLIGRYVPPKQMGSGSSAKRPGRWFDSTRGLYMVGVPEKEQGTGCEPVHMGSSPIIHPYLTGGHFG